MSYYCDYFITANDRKFTEEEILKIKKFFNKINFPDVYVKNIWFDLTGKFPEKELNAIVLSKIQWREEEIDMKNLSKKMKDILFKIISFGEDQPDYCCSFYKNGLSDKVNLRLIQERETLLT